MIKSDEIVRKLNGPDIWTILILIPVFRSRIPAWYETSLFTCRVYHRQLVLPSTDRFTPPYNVQGMKPLHFLTERSSSPYTHWDQRLPLLNTYTLTLQHISDWNSLNFFIIVPLNWYRWSKRLIISPIFSYWPWVLPTNYSFLSQQYRNCMRTWVWHMPYSGSIYNKNLDTVML